MGSGPEKLPGLSRNGPLQTDKYHNSQLKYFIFCEHLNALRDLPGPGNAGNGFSKSPISKLSQGGMHPHPPRSSCLRHSCSRLRRSRPLVSPMNPALSDVTKNPANSALDYNLKWTKTG